MVFALTYPQAFPLAKKAYAQRRFPSLRSSTRLPHLALVNGRVLTENDASQKLSLSRVAGRFGPMIPVRGATRFSHRNLP